MENVNLRSGYEIPVVGLGTWDLRGRTCQRAVKEALALGYTHIDTAWYYENQRSIGEALRGVDVDRSALFITSKVWMSHLRYDDALKQCEENVRDLQTEYVDLMLIHWPNDSVPVKETLRAFQETVEAGLAKSIGVSNFSVDQMEEAVAVSDVPISVNQISYSPGSEQRDVLAWCREKDVVVTSYSPLAKRRILNDPMLAKIGSCLGRSVAQVALKWLIQKGMVVIPKSSSKNHLAENLDVMNWELGQEEMDQIDAMGE